MPILTGPRIFVCLDRPLNSSSIRPAQLPMQLGGGRVATREARRPAKGSQP